MASILKKIFGDGNQKQIKRIKKQVDQIEALEPDVEKLSDNELSGKTQEFRERLANGEGVDDLLVEAYAVVREASKRILDMRPFQSQLIGAIALHEGNIAEMKT